MKPASLLLPLACLLSISCTSTQPDVEPGYTADKIYAATYAWGPEVRSVTLCADPQTAYWVSFSWAGRQMQDYYQANQTEPYQRMYIRFRGHLLDEKVDGFALDYDGLMRLSEVYEYTFDIPETCQ